VGKGRPAYNAENLTAISEPIAQKMWEPRRLTILLASMACYRDNFTFLYKTKLFQMRQMRCESSYEQGPNEDFAYRWLYYVSKCRPGIRLESLRRTADTE
jgi:hypothetical protein